MAGATEKSLLQNIQNSSSTEPASKSIKTRAFFLAVKWPEWSLNTHICPQPSLKFCGAIPPQHPQIILTLLRVQITNLTT
jgi:hypothetical protein